jgi:tripartite-type tricarboxylate transporter receptor subunit TctC
MAESGFPGFEEYVGPVGFVAPAGTPQVALDKLANAIRSTLTKPAIDQKLRQLGSNACMRWKKRASRTCRPAKTMGR